MSILSTIEAAVSVGPYPVTLNNSVYYVGPWPISADSNFIGPYGIDNTNSLVGPWQFYNDGTNNWLGPWIVA
jgi:hypothetical protein